MKFISISTATLIAVLISNTALAQFTPNPNLATAHFSSTASTNISLQEISATKGLTARIVKLLKDNTDGGVVGLYLKQVKGSVLASSQSQTTFYPASTIKVLQHFHAMRAVEAGNVSLDSTKVKVYPNPPDSCSDNHAGQNFNNDTLRETLAKMMKNSDNQSTNAIQELFGNGNASIGRNAINKTAHNVIGMSKNSAVNHKSGCGGPSNNPANSLTLVDLGKLYEKVATGVFSSNSTRDTFYNLMIRSPGQITTVINEEAAKLGLNANIIQSFKNQVRTAVKAGGYTTGNGTKYNSIGGWVRLPFKKNGVVKSQEYVFGIFIDQATKINENFGVGLASSELLRDEIRAALTTFK